MNRKYTLLVLVAAVALVGLALWQRDATPVDLAKGTATPTPGPILSLDPTTIQEVQIAGPAGKSVTLKRAAGGWEVDGQKAADTVNTAVEGVAKMAALSTLSADRKPADYGFETPTLTVTLKTASGADTVLYVGDNVVGESSSSYIRLAGTDSAIHVVSNTDLTTMKDWLDKPPLAPTPTPAGGSPAPGLDLSLPGGGTLPPPGEPLSGTLPITDTLPVMPPPTTGPTATP
jgi:hypothetical protein